MSFTQHTLTWLGYDSGIRVQCQPKVYLPGFPVSAVGFLLQEGQEGLQVGHMGGGGGGGGGPGHDPPPVGSEGTCHLQLVSNG